MEIPTNPYRDSRKAALWGIGVSLLLGVVKLFGGLFGNSLALLSDAVHSLVDAAVSLALLVALYLAQVRDAKFPEEIAGVLADLAHLPDQVEQAIALDAHVRSIAERFLDARDFLFIGRHTGYPAALEGALKLKELSYIHASGYPAGELKHGPIALVDTGVPVVAIATRCHVYPKMVSNIQEVKARGASVIAIVSAGDVEAARLADHVIDVPETPELLAPVVVTVPLQLLAYHVAVLHGRDVDQPRNLAKSVTVE